MPGKRRERDDAEHSHKPKKIKFDNEELKTNSNLVPDEIDFPRGGGSALTALEYKTTRAEAIKEADANLVFEDSQATKKKKKKRSDTGSDFKSGRQRKGAGDAKKKKGESIRVEHLNYKRLLEGMKILCQIISIQPLVLIVSLPSQLVGHIPITHISTQLTQQLEAMDVEDAESTSQDGDGLIHRRAPELFEIFHVGQYVRAIVTTVRPAGASARDIIGLRQKLDETERACQRVELSLIPEKVNVGVSKEDLTQGFIVPAAIQSVEDHGYVLDLGVSSITGFLPFKAAQKGPNPEKMAVGHVLDVCVSEMAENRRTCTVSVDTTLLTTSFLSQITSVTSVLPGTLVEALITAVVPSGLNVQLLGYFEGTIDEFHLPPGESTNHYKLGQQVKARILWDMITSEPRTFALSLLPHVVDLDVHRLPNQQPVQEAFPIGTILEAVKIIRVEVERGLIIEVQEGVLGYVHIRHVSDSHVPSLSPNSGHWKVGTVHRARVIGFQAVDGIVQLSLQQSVLEQRFLQVADVEVGETLKATVKKLTTSGLFVSISGNVDGVIWPNHYADIALKHPQKRFKEGSAVKCKVLVVDTQRKRVALTAKKTIVESDLPIITRLDDAQVGTVTHAVVYKVLEKSILVEFYNNLRAQVTLKEASETPLANLGQAFPIGKPIKVRIISVDRETGRIGASIRQTTSKVIDVLDVHGVQVGETVKGPIKAIHKDHAVVTLDPTGITALLSLKNLANSRDTTSAQLLATLAVGERLNDLIVISHNQDKGIVIVSKRPKSKPQPGILPGNEGITPQTIEVGQRVSGQVTGYRRGATILHITSDLKGLIYPTDTCDNFETGTAFPSVGSIIEGVILSIEKSHRQLTLSTRASRLNPSEVTSLRDREISKVSDLKAGETVRGFIKSVTDHGLFVTLGRRVDARIQIKELFDEYIKDWKPCFELHQIVQGKVLRVDSGSGQVEMSLRSKPVELGLEEFQEGQKVDGVVRRKEDYGVFIQIKDTKISGLCHKSQVSDNVDANVQQVLDAFQEGDPVRAIILTINLEKKQISFGLKPSYFADDDFEMHNAQLSSDQADDLPQNDDTHSESEESDDSEVIELNDSGPELELPKPQDLPSSEKGSALRLQKGFQWSTQTAEPEGADLSNDELDKDPSQTKISKKKKAIEYDLTADLQTRQPESTADYERLLLGSPNSSYLWIQYMSFQLQLSEIEKAKEVGKRALRTINFREEDEKLNVWLALLNLENKYGTDESLETVFRDAARHNDSKTIHLRLASIFDETDRYDRATEQYQRTCKKFGKSSKVWTLFGEHHMKHGNVEAARQLLPRSLQSLEKRKHLKTISKFAQLEYKVGDPERGRTIFEGIVDSHPKRWDLWSIYADMETMQRNIQGLRNIFDRVLALKMTSHKAKAFFKKWLDLEKRLGNEEGEEAVKAKAIEWTRRAAGAGAA